MTALPRDTRLPDGFCVRLAAGVKAYDHGGTLFGGSPARLLYLKPAAQRLLASGDLVVGDATTANLARLLLDRGLADPVLGPPTRSPTDTIATTKVTVVVPVRDRTSGVARLLAALPAEVSVIVVDDGSADPTALGRIARERGATVLRHEVSRGPAAARNTGLKAVTTPVVAFIDSDVVPRDGWLDLLLAHFADPLVGIVAPRVAALTAVGEQGGAIARYEAACSSLDLGPEPALVAPRGRVAYVPTACLVGRLEAFGDGFDETLHVAEDVDLVWRAIEAGWRVRYEPASVVQHDHRITAGSWLVRKAFYGTGAAPLALRHPGAVAPVVMSPWTAAVAAALLCQRRWSVPVAAAITVGATVRLSRSLKHSEHPVSAAARLTPYGVVAALWQTSNAVTRHWWPLAVIAAVGSRRARRIVLVASVADGVVSWRRTRPGLDPLTFTLLRRADDLAYGAGLWWGALRHRTAAPLLPALARAG